GICRACPFAAVGGSSSTSRIIARPFTVSHPPIGTRRPPRQKGRAPARRCLGSTARPRVPRRPGPSPLAGQPAAALHCSIAPHRPTVVLLAPSPRRPVRAHLHRWSVGPGRCWFPGLAPPHVQRPTPRLSGYRETSHGVERDSP